MEKVKVQFQMVYNSGFRHGWKFALSKIEQPKMSDLFLCANTPLPYPEAGLKNSDDEVDEEDDEGEEEEEEEEEKTEEVQGEKDQPQESS
jgi:ribosomal protein L12E/L44/L45/RPP1/RPP2